MLGMIPGNGHPYSWSAIINGYDPSEMARCPYPVIPSYLANHANEPMPLAEVTHIWTDQPAEAKQVAAAANIPNVVAAPEDVIGEVDGVIIATDNGDDHIWRVRPFVEAGLPVFVDKPLATNLEDLQHFERWVKGGARIQSSSGMRYAPELQDLEGDWRWITACTPKTWERYGIHLLEPVAKILGPGFERIRLVSDAGSSVAHITHQCGSIITLAAMDEVAGGMFTFHAHGKSDYRSVALTDTYAAFRHQLEAVAGWMRGGPEPVAFAQTRELMAVLIAGIASRQSGGMEMDVTTFLTDL